MSQTRQKIEVPSSRIIQFFAMQRSGHHAVLVHYVSKLPDKIVYHWNRCSFTSNAIDVKRIVKYTDGEYYELNNRRTRHEFTTNSVISNHFIEPGAILIISFEDYQLQKIPPLAASKRILVLRDPYNQTASRIKRGGRNTILPGLWVEHAYEFIGRTEFLGPHDNISFNKWHQETQFDVVLKYGAGSSFDGLRMHGRGHQMDVLNRWKIVVDDERFRRVAKRYDVGVLADRIFGWRIMPDMTLKHSDK